MGFLDWTADLNVDVPTIDRQHRKLVEMINTLHDAMAQGKGASALGAILEEMAAYARTHFRTEEDLMAAHAFPGLGPHKKEHEAFTAKVDALLAQFRQSPTGLSVEVNAFLKSWLTAHIRGTDQAYAPYLRERGVR